MQETRETDRCPAVPVKWSDGGLQRVLCREVLPSLAAGEVFLELCLQG